MLRPEALLQEAADTDMCLLQLKLALVTPEVRWKFVSATQIAEPNTLA